jgi:N-acetylmuramic acid 6-phosphate etherase
MSELPTTEQVNPNSEGLDRYSTLQMLTCINDEDATVHLAVRSQLPQIALAVDAIAERLSRGGRLVYLGAGTSGRLGVLDASECLPTFGVSPEMVLGVIAGGDRALRHAIEGAEDDADAGVAAIDALSVGPDDAVVGMSASGGAPYVRAAVARARELGAVTISIATARGALLSGDVDIPIEAVVGAEVLTGSTRMKSGTAQKLICNMLTTGAMIKIGKTYGNRMVDVQATNKKLVDRATRLIQDIGKVDRACAESLLAEAGGSAKIGIVMARRGVGAAEARELLEAAGGYLARVIDDPKPQEI